MKMTILERDDDITHVVLTGRLDWVGQYDSGFGNGSRRARKRVGAGDPGFAPFAPDDPGTGSVPMTPR